MPRVVDGELRRQDIARAALKVFTRKGYRLAGMGDVSRECAIGRTTFYQSFQTLVTLEFWVELRRSRPGSSMRKRSLPLSREAERFQRAVVRVFEAGVAAGELRARNLAGLAFLTHSLLASLCLQSMRDPHAMPERSLHVLDLFVDAWSSIPAWEVDT